MRARIEWAFIIGVFTGAIVWVASGLWWTLPLALAIAFTFEVFAEMAREEFARMHNRIDLELEWDREGWSDD